jgi:hypothetical protein
MKTVMVSVLLLSGACFSPAYANYFHNPNTNTNLNIGSAPNPTPADLRAIGDSIYGFDARPGANRQGMNAMKGKMVMGSGGETVGVVLAVDDIEKVVLIETPMGMHVVVAADVLRDDGGRVVAVTLTPARVAALAMGQEGRMAVYNNGRWTH